LRNINNIIISAGPGQFILAGAFTFTILTHFCAMENNSDNLSPEESLQVIQSMINQTKNSVVDNSFYFLLWGWLVLIGALLQYTLKVIVRTDLHPVAWNIMWLGFIVSIFRKVKEKRRPVITYVDEGLRHIWLCIAIVQTLIVFIFMRRGGWENCYTFFILLYSIGCFLTGRLLKFSPLVWGAITCWALAILTTFVGYDMNILLLAAAILVSYIIPGYLLRKEHKRQLLNPDK
jgi:hypothetical protein